MVTIVEWLREQINADEQTARQVDAREWSDCISDLIEPGSPFLGPGMHAQRFDPARVLAELEAKWAVLDLHAGLHECMSRNGDISADLYDPGADQYEPHLPPCPTLLILAQPYAGRAGWQPEWESK